MEKLHISPPFARQPLLVGILKQRVEGRIVGRDAVRQEVLALKQGGTGGRQQKPRRTALNAGLLLRRIDLLRCGLVLPRRQQRTRRILVVLGQLAGLANQRWQLRLLVDRAYCIAEALDVRVGLLDVVYVRFADDAREALIDSVLP